MVVLEKVAEGGLADEENKITMETTDQTDPGTGTGCRIGQWNDGLLRTGGGCAEHDCRIRRDRYRENGREVAEKPAAEDKTVSGDTVSAEPKVQEAESADDEAGIAVQADDDTASGPIEVKIYGNTETYTTFEEMVKAVKVSTDVYIKLLGDVTDAVNWDIYTGYNYSNVI